MAPQNITKLLDHLGILISEGTLTTRAVSHAMSAHYGGTDASGAWSWRMAYDLMEGAFVRLVHTDKRLRPVQEHMGYLNAVAKSLPTQTRRSETQIRLQQFSTPLEYAFAATRAAALQDGDVVLEPSAGTGSMLCAPDMRKLTCHINEIDPFRASILKAIYNTNVTQHDAEHIDDLLDPTIGPDVILMNPPFSSSADRSADPNIAAKHIISAAKRLNAGGRLVAIMPMSFTPERQSSYWTRLNDIVVPRMALTLPGHIYRKQGTTVDTQLIICDKLADDGGRCFRARAESLRVLLDMLPSELPLRQAPRSKSPRLTKTTSISAVTSRQKPSPRQAQPGATSAQIKPSAAIEPVAYEIYFEPKENQPVSDVYARYAPQRIALQDAQDHPTALVESIAMASVVPPIPDGSPMLPKKIIEGGILSDAQLETIVMANSAHDTDLPGRFMINEENTNITREDDNADAMAYRKGFFLGDGTGCGKGRQVAGMIMANRLAGRQRAIWISKSATLIEDSIRDWRDLGGSPTDIQPLSKWKPDEDITLGAGILFVTYATLRSIGKSGRSRLQQVLDWAGQDFDGVIGFDEAHAMQNAGGSTGGRGEVKPSQQGIAGLRLQLGLPRARVMYVSATGATQVQNLAYASRLGLWGQGIEYAFMSREEFVSSMEAGGVAAMEVVARDLKALGLYTARALSFDGIEYDIAEHELSADQIAVYDAYAEAFKIIHQNLDKALEATGIVSTDGETQSSGAKSAAKSRFESLKQRFFNHLILGMKTPSIIAMIEADMAEGWAPVIQIVSTGESLLKRRIEQLGPDDTLVEGSLTPREYVMGYLEHAFPIHTQKLIETEDGQVIAEPLRDEHGQLVVSREAVALRDEVMEDLMCLAPIPSALDQILWHFGSDAVAEVTGRSIRPLKSSDGQLYIEKRAASANSAETTAFMAGDKSILIFSDAGGTGRSYHAAQSAQNQKRRRHYLLEPGGRADAAIQGLGRTRRSAQVSAPWFRVCTSNVHGEKRFSAAICKRLQTLGALTKGERQTGSQGLFREEDNLESPIARSSLRALYSDFARGSASSMSFETFTDWTALKIMDKEGVLLEELPPIQRFLNRVLALPINLQNALFEEFMDKIAVQTERAREAGTLDVGVETLRGETITQTDSEDLWTCPKSGSVTRIVSLTVENPKTVLNGRETVADYGYDRVPMLNTVSGKVGLISKRPFQVYDDDTMLMMRRITRPDDKGLMGEAKFAKSNWEPISQDLFIQRWDEEADTLPRKTIEEKFLLTGLLLPIWKRIPTRNERIYRVSPENAHPMIGRSLDEDQAATVRATFMTDEPDTPEAVVKKVLGSTAPVGLGQGLALTRRRVAGAVRLEIEGADRAMVKALKDIGCFTEIIAFQLRLFVPHGEDVDTVSILRVIMGTPDATSCAA